MDRRTGTLMPSPPKAGSQEICSMMKRVRIRSSHNSPALSSTNGIEEGTVPEGNIYIGRTIEPYNFPQYFRSLKKKYGVPPGAQWGLWHLWSPGMLVQFLAPHSGLKIQYFCTCSIGHSCSKNLIPGPENQNAVGGKKKKKKKKERNLKIHVVDISRSPLLRVLIEQLTFVLGIPLSEHLLHSTIEKKNE